MFCFQSISVQFQIYFVFRTYLYSFKSLAFRASLYSFKSVFFSEHGSVQFQICFVFIASLYSFKSVLFSEHLGIVLNVLFSELLYIVSNLFSSQSISIQFLIYFGSQSILVQFQIFLALRASQYSFDTVCLLQHLNIVSNHFINTVLNLFFCVLTSVVSKLLFVHRTLLSRFETFFFLFRTCVWYQIFFSIILKIFYCSLQFQNFFSVLKISPYCCKPLFFLRIFPYSFKSYFFVHRTSL